MRLVIAATACLLLPVSASAQEPGNAPPPRPEVVNRMLACRALQPEAERLACFDREVAAFETAATARELVVYDREQVQRTRRSLFGITLPSFNIFGGGNEADDPDEVAQIESTIRRATQDSEGRYVFTLEDGARWAQVDRREFSATPRAGQKIRIRRAAIGSYLANVGSQTAVRVRRILPAD